MEREKNNISRGGERKNVHGHRETTKGKRYANQSLRVERSVRGRWVKKDRVTQFEQRKNSSLLKESWQ